MQRTRTPISRSKLLAAGLATLAVVITLFVWFEVTKSREELLGFVASEAEVLIETVNRSAETTVAANAELENTIVQRLRLAALLVDENTSRGRGSAGNLSVLAREADLDRIVLFDAGGRIEGADAAGVMPGTELPADSALRRDLLQPVLDGEFSWLAEGPVATPPDGRRMFVLVQERQADRGAILLGVSSDAMLAMRLRLGIGTLMRDIGSSSSISYLVLQDENGLITASGGVEEMHSIESDPFLRDAFRHEDARSRLLDDTDPPTFEIVKSVVLHDNAPALMRIGLSLEQVQNIQQRSMRRVIFIAVGFFITAAVFLVLMLTRQRYGVLQQEHRKVRGYTDLVLDSMADAVVATDAAGTVTVFNQAAVRLLGRSAAAALDASCEQICPEDALLLHRTRASSRPVDYEETMLDLATGDRRTLAVSTSLIRDDGGAVETIVSIARDVTEQRRVQEQLQRRDRVVAMGELAGGIAHEIRNPLNAINIIAQRFQHEFVPSQDAEEYTLLAQTVRSEVQRVNRIITQFLEFARPPMLDRHPCDLGTLVAASLDVVRSQASARGIDMPLILAEGLVVSADREKMTQVLLNLYQNAIDAVADSGSVKTITCRQGAMAAIFISDNGHGMPEEVRQNIFNLYFTTKATGTGLGLSIVHQIVSEHGGAIEVVSNEEGGTTFQVLLPLHAPTDDHARTAVTDL